MKTYPDKYGCHWTEQLDEAQIEQKYIINGGYVIGGTVKYGLGLIHHFKVYWELLWPDDSQTWWTDLILKEILANQFTALVGPASSWKSGTVARIALMDWSCFPDCTTIIMSSTHMEGLRARIYGETTKMWHLAKENYDWFPGNPIDSRCVITNENVEEDKARDIRNSIVGVPCQTSTGRFVGMGKYCMESKTLVDTPNGKIPISKIRPGDLVYSAIGISSVESVNSHWVSSLVRAWFEDGTFIDCTPEHPFLTSLGWVNFGCLSSEHRLYSPHETMSIMRERHAELPSEQEILLRGVRNGQLFQKLQGVRKVVHSERCTRSFLHSLLRVEMEDESAGYCEEDDFGKEFRPDWKGYQPGHYEQPQGIPTQAKTCLKIPVKIPARLEFWNCFTDPTRTGRFGFISRSPMGIFGSNREKRETWNGFILPIRRILAKTETGRGTGWGLSQPTRAEKERFGANEIPKVPRLERLEILKPRHKISQNRSGNCYQVYNIEVKGHPSYSVNGCIVHNSGRKNRRVWCISDEFQFMQLSILDAQDNLISNGPNLVPGIITDRNEKEYGKPIRGYKGVFIGNTNPTVPGNPLDIVCEPEHGFNSIPDDGKTKVWNCKRVPNHPVKCRCVNLDALDSPNNSFPEDKPKWIQLSGKHMLKQYAEGSESYYSQGRGVFKFGMAAFKIITKEVAEQFHCFDSLVWEGSEIIKIGMCDAAYGVVGGDRCPLGWLEFGKCLDGKIRILFHPYWLVPIVANNQMIPEDQIALFTKEKMESVGVPPENFFFDGRGSLAMSFARIWSPKVNAIEFGGKPSNRPVQDEYVFDKEKNMRRLKLAYEHYSKFVSELWWSWRRTIESDQIRGLTLDVVLDAQPREWYKVSGDRIEVETKKDMKKRTGISPDLADMVVAGIEGARRRGFIIGNLGTNDEKSQVDRWLIDKSKERFKWHQSKHLVHS